MTVHTAWLVQWSPDCQTNRRRRERTTLSRTEGEGTQVPLLRTFLAFIQGLDLGWDMGKPDLSVKKTWWLQTLCGQRKLLCDLFNTDGRALCLNPFVILSPFEINDLQRGSGEKIQVRTKQTLKPVSVCFYRKLDLRLRLRDGKDQPADKLS